MDKDAVIKKLVDTMPPGRGALSAAFKERLQGLMTESDARHKLVLQFLKSLLEGK